MLNLSLTKTQRGFGAKSNGGLAKNSTGVFTKSSLAVERRPFAKLRTTPRVFRLSTPVGVKKAGWRVLSFAQVPPLGYNG